MKQLLLLILLSTTISIQSQIVPSSCTIPPTLANVYKSDIVDLAIKRMFQVHSPDTALVTVPQAWKDTIGEGLAAIYNASSLPESDTVFNCYCIHDHSWVQSYPLLLVSVDTSYSWTQEWQTLNSITGNPFIDSLMIKYQLNIDDFYYNSSGNMASMFTPSWWNTYALLDSLEQEPGVFYASINHYLGASVSTTIQYDKIGNDRYFSFDYGWSDCIAGCINHRIWHFKVDPECQVEYLGSTNVVGTPDPIPPSLCGTPLSNFNQEQTAQFTAFPNPTKNNVTLRLDKPVSGAELTLYNVLGQSLETIAFVDNEKIMIDMTRHPIGLYLFKLSVGNKIIGSGKLIRE